MCPPTTQGWSHLPCLRVLDSWLVTDPGRVREWGVGCLPRCPRVLLSRPAEELVPCVPRAPTLPVKLAKPSSSLCDLRHGAGPPCCRPPEPDVTPDLHPAVVSRSLTSPPMSSRGSRHLQFPPLRDHTTPKTTRDLEANPDLEPRQGPRPTAPQRQVEIDTLRLDSLPGRGSDDSNDHRTGFFRPRRDVGSTGGGGLLPHRGRRDRSPVGDVSLESDGTRKRER